MKQEETSGNSFYLNLTYSFKFVVKTILTKLSCVASSNDPYQPRYSDNNGTQLRQNDVKQLLLLKNSTKGTFINTIDNFARLVKVN